MWKRTYNIPYFVFINEYIYDTMHCGDNVKTCYIIYHIIGNYEKGDSNLFSYFSFFDLVTVIFAILCFALVFFLFKKFLRPRGIGKLDNCNVCKKEVASTAYNCPHCGASLGLHPVFRLILVILLWMVVVFISIIGIIFLKMFLSSISSIF
jgi:hypothetical protein